MVYESSYESGSQPFLPDAKRGHWANPQDFIYAGLSLAFRADIFSWFMFMGMDGISFFPMYLLSLGLYIVPFLVIQSFMGQFSSSGFISAFRLSPLFKGIGYVTLAVNVCVLAYYSVYAMMPLLYMFASMNPTLPWSCESFKTWATNLTEEQETNLCNLNFENKTYIVEGLGGEENRTYEKFVNHHIPSVLYFENLFHDTKFFDPDDRIFSMSWQLIICALLVWTIVALVVYKIFNTEMFGTIIRYCVWITLGIMGFLLVRFSFIPGAASVYGRYISPTWQGIASGLVAVPLCAMTSFGPGWGLFITLSSYNKFKTNIIKSSWLIGLGQCFIILGLDLLLKFTDKYFTVVTNDRYYVMEHTWTLYLSSGSVMAHMAWANMWCILFFFMMFLSAMLLILIQLNSILTTIYDEFISLRERRLSVAMGLIGLMAVCSLYFTSNDGITSFTVLATDVYVTQSAINLLLILVVLWIYGRVRFQRDIEFMTDQRFSTWIINILRFVSPLGMILALIAGFHSAYYEHLFSYNIFIDVVAIICIVLPWICIPGYAIYKIYLGIGPIKIRFFRCCRPTDWTPVDAEYRQKYEEAMGNSDMTHTFNDLKDAEVA